MQHQGDVVGGLVDAVQRLKVQALPVGGVDAVDVADAGCQEVDAQLGDAGALGGVGDLAGTHDAVLNAADGADLGLDGHAVGMGQGHQLLGLFHVLLDGVVAAVKHDGGEAGLDAGLAALVGAVVQVQRHRDGDAHGIHHGLDHGGHGLEAGHVLAGALGHAQDDGALGLLAGGQDRFGPLQVVDVELGHAIVAVPGFQKHFSCIYQHCSYLQHLFSVYNKSLFPPPQRGRGPASSV